MTTQIIKKAILNALATTTYIVMVSLFIFYVPEKFEPNIPETVLIPIAMLSLLVFSAATVGSLIFARPVLWYLDGKKKEAVTLLVYTLASFFVITIVLLSVLFFVQIAQPSLTSPF